MSPKKAAKAKQPAHLRGEDVCNGIAQGYDEAMLASIRDDHKVLAFDYKYGSGKSDRDALHKYTRAPAERSSLSLGR